jgi:hypothetical protein
MTRTTIDVAEYTDAFRTWGRVAKASDHALSQIDEACAMVERKFRGEVPIESLCEAISAWIKVNPAALGAFGFVGKSCLLARLIYAGERLRTRPCPIHRGNWSGWRFEECPGRCNFGPNLTGWMPNDLVDEWPAEADDPVRARLAATLRASWTREHAAIYADHLQTQGDPHGELIAIDLALEVRRDLELERRREVVLEAWCDELLAPPRDELVRPSSLHGRIRTTWGFLDARLDSAKHVRSLFDHPCGRYLRRVELRGEPTELFDAVRLFASRTHPWLAEIAIANEPQLEGPDVIALRASAPCLATIEIV